MEVKLYRFPNKQIRAKAIKRYMEKAGYKKAVCFSCGNASRALKEAGVDTLDISKSGDFVPLRWFTQYEIKQTFPDMFDATSGHLPLECMKVIAADFKSYIGSLPDEIYLPTGSGETLVELKMAFPESKITAVYNLDDATSYDEGCVLNELVMLLAEKVVFYDKERMEDRD